MSGSISMDPGLAALAQQGRPPAQLVSAGKGDVATTRGDLGRVTVGYRPLDSERHARGLFEATTARVYGLAGGRLAQVLASPELEQLWRDWREGAFAEFPGRVTLPGPDAPRRRDEPPRAAVAALAPPGAGGAALRPARP
jgi:hypothetical protein